MVHVDKEKCIGCGACVAVCENGFELIDGFSVVKNEKAECINEAVEVCPVSAISLNEK